jgi:hypothetical protein
MNEHNIVISLKRFLLIEQCPAAWKEMDLYLFRDAAVVFYVGQSELAFARVWEHLKGGFKGHSMVGRFVWANWPSSMNFTIELFSSKSDQFCSVNNDLSAAERQLIQYWSPCFNVSQNINPTPMPEYYFPPNARFRCSRSLNRLMHEAERAVMAEEKQLWIRELE